jgi:hypothetical protein
LPTSKLPIAKMLAAKNVDLDLTCLSNVMPAAGRQVGSALYMEEEK